MQQTFNFEQIAREQGRKDARAGRALSDYPGEPIGEEYHLVWESAFLNELETISREAETN